jgi:ribosomal protein L11 methyltransferase
VSITVPFARAEVARARMIDLFPQGFEEVEHGDGVELVAYTDSRGEERLWQAFGQVSAAAVEEGWEHRWRMFHQPVEVAGIWIGPPWLPEPPRVPTVVIDPGRAFGTGSHPTTRLALQLLAKLRRGSLLDVGCGSGVIAIAAAKLGFGPIAAWDVEASAIEATLRNAAANHVELEAHLGDATAVDLEPADVCVANVTLEVVARVAPRVRCRHLVTSGYLLSDELRAHGFHLVERIEEGGWAADLFRSAAQ